MKFISPSRKSGFTLIETVIAIGVLAVLLTGFMVVFAPAADGIRKSINVQQADRMATTLEQELVNLRPTETATYTKSAFNKAFDWIKKSNSASDALMVYQYRSEVGATIRPDGSPSPTSSLIGKIPGKDYVVIPMVRRKSDSEFVKDLAALEGAVYAVKATQLIFSGTGELIVGSPGNIKDPKGSSTAVTSGDDYPEAVIAFAAEFYLMPSRSKDYFSGQFNTKFASFKNPVFTRNLAVRR